MRPSRRPLIPRLRSLPFWRGICFWRIETGCRLCFATQTATWTPTLTYASDDRWALSQDALQIDGLAGAFGHWNSALLPVSASISNIRADSSYGLGAFMEDQPTEIAGEVGQDKFRHSAHAADAADEQAEPVLPMREDVFHFGGAGQADVSAAQLPVVCEAPNVCSLGAAVGSGRRAVLVPVIHGRVDRIARVIVGPMVIEHAGARRTCSIC